MLFKKYFLVLFILLLSGCGWRPVYYQDTADQSEDTACVDILPIPEETGRFLRLKLEDLLNPQKQDLPKKYVLQVSLSETINSDQGILGDNTATRATMRITAYILLKQDGNVLLNTSTFATSSYNILMLPYPTVTAENATRHRLLEMLSNQIATRVTVYLKKQDNQ